MFKLVQTIEQAKQLIVMHRHHYEKVLICTSQPKLYADLGLPNKNVGDPNYIMIHDSILYVDPSYKNKGQYFDVTVRFSGGRGNFIIMHDDPMKHLIDSINGSETD